MLKGLPSVFIVLALLFNSSNFSGSMISTPSKTRKVSRELDLQSKVLYFQGSVGLLQFLLVLCILMSISE